MRHLEGYELFEGENSKFIKDFLTDFGTLISLNFSQITKMGKDEDAKKELTLMMQTLRSPIINGLNYFDFLKDNINNITNNPKALSALLDQIRKLLSYIEPRVKRYVADGEAPNGINYKEAWINRIDTIKKDYVKIIS